MALVAILTLTFCSCEQKAKDVIVAKPGNTITPKAARALQNNFVRTRAGVLNDTLGYTDVRDITFSLNEIEQYIDYIKQETSDTDPSNIDLRIYFGATHPTPDRRSGLSTVFIAPVVKGAKQEGAMFFSLMQDGLDPLNRGTGGEPPHNY